MAENYEKGAGTRRFFLRRENRIQRRADFQATYESGVKVRRRFIHVFVRQREDPAMPTRLGVTVTRKYGKAVFRNRFRRRIREVFRLVLPDLAPGYTIVVNALRGSADASYAELEENFQSALRKAGVLKSSSGTNSHSGRSRADRESHSSGAGAIAEKNDIAGKADSTDREPVSGTKGHLCRDDAEKRPDTPHPAFRMPFPNRILLWMVRGYQKFVSPLLPPGCRYYPSCSRYAAEALRRKPFVVAVGLIIWRLMRCNPLSRGGYDPLDRR